MVAKKKSTDSLKACFEYVNIQSYMYSEGTNHLLRPFLCIHV